jgi:hypothetical protein
VILGYGLLDELLYLLFAHIANLAPENAQYNGIDTNRHVIATISPVYLFF